MSLNDWAKNGWLDPRKTSKAEIDGLLSIAERELKDSQIKALSADGQFTHAYHCCLSLATALLYGSGFSPARGQSHHYRVIAAVPEILGNDTKDDSDYLDKCRSRRNAAEYDAANEASRQEAEDLVQFAKEFRTKVLEWLGKRRIR